MEGVIKSNLHGNKLQDWPLRWGMLFNVQKCKVMHLGRHNNRAQYVMNGTMLETTSQERRGSDGEQ